MNLQEIKNSYNKLIEDVKTKEFYTKIDLNNRFNCYVCPNGHVTKTQDIDAGVTSMFIHCDKCGLRASSSFYRDIAPNIKPTKEWYRPGLDETLKLNHSLEHVLRGGLLIRNI